MSSTDIIGHGKTIDLLKRAIGANRIAHAYLFVGPDGIGKRLVALNFAKVLNCEAHGTEPCDECPSCRKVETGNHVDVQVCAPRGLSRQLKVEQVEQFIDQVNLCPYEGRWKVFILCDADRANLSFQNKILKVLEEPPGQTLIILVTSNTDGLLPTIRSRCQALTFSQLPIAEIEKHLIAGGAVPERARQAAVLSQGRMGKAFQWLDDELLRQRRGLFTLVSSRERPPVEEIVSMATEVEGRLRKKRDAMISGELDIAKKSPNWTNMGEAVRSRIEEEIKADAEGRFRQEAVEVLNYLASLYRDVLLLRETGRDDLAINADMLDLVRDKAARCTSEEIMRNMKAIDSTLESIARNVKISNCLEALFLRLTDTDREITWTKTQQR